MASWADNRRPPAPQGVTRTAREDRGIVPGSSGRGEKHDVLSVPAGMFFCALGGAVASSTLSFVGPAIASYGYLPVASQRSFPARIACLAAMLVPAIALGSASGASTVATAVIATLTVLVVCELTVARRLTPGALCATVGLASVALLAADELVALASGTTLSASIQASLDVYRQQVDELLVGAADQVEAVFAALGLLWPVAYVMTALGLCVSALVGASAHPSGSVARPPRLVDFDLPLWVVAVFVASIAGLALAVSVDGPASQVALAVSANVAMAVRFAFAAQGLAVVAWSVRKKGLGSVASTLVGVVALYLEVQFVVLTIVGLVDVWANLRHLKRGGSTDVAEQTMQD